MIIGGVRLNEKRNYKQFIIILLGSGILSFGLYNIHNQSLITEGGVLGLSLLLGHWTLISPGFFSLILDIGAYLMAYKYLGKDFIIKSFIASIFYFGWFMIFEYIGPIVPNLSEYPLVASIFGGLFVGVGVGLVVRMGGACGGDDALALTIHHSFNLNLSKSYLLSDIVVLLLSLTYIPYINILYSLLTVSISSFLIGRIQTFELKRST